jgi:hypothetical protein
LYCPLLSLLLTNIVFLVQHEDVTEHGQKKRVPRLNEQGKKIPHTAVVYNKCINEIIDEFNNKKSKVSKGVQKLSPQLSSLVQEYHKIYYVAETKNYLESGSSEGWKLLQTPDKVTS